MKAALVPMCIHNEFFTACMRNKKTRASCVRVIGNFRQQCETGSVFAIAVALMVLVA